MPADTKAKLKAIQYDKNYSRKEKWIHQDTFETFFLMGPARTYKKLAEATGKNYQSLLRWGKVGDWNAKLAERDNHAVKQLVEDDDKAYLEEVKKRHQEAYRKVQEVSMKELKKKTAFFESARDAAQALDIGIKGEREVLGLRNTNIKAALAKEGFAALVEAVIGPGGS